MSARKQVKSYETTTVRNLPQKRSRRVLDDESENYDSDIKEVNTKSTEREYSHSKRYKKSNVPNFDELGADISSPEKQASTKQSDNDEEQLINSTSKNVSKLNHKSVSENPSPTKENGALIPQGQAMANYLNEENLKHLQRISECVKLDFSAFIKQMIKDNEHEEDGESETKFIFEKRKLLNISTLQQRTQHLQKNKLSDKFSRRDIQFYDMYIKKENGEDLGLLRDKQFPLDIDAHQYYEEMEVDDFNHLWANNKLIQERFGKTLKVELQVDGKTAKTKNQLLNLKVQRKVKEFPELVKVSETRRVSTDINASPQKTRPDSKDPDLMNIHASLKQFEREYGKTHEEIADIFCRVSGRLNKIKDYLDNKPVIEWTYLEDLALAKPDDSPEFQVLLQTKGWEEIIIRREFLHAIPVINEDEDKK